MLDTLVYMAAGGRPTEIDYVWKHWTLNDLMWSADMKSYEGYCETIGLPDA